MASSSQKMSLPLSRIRPSRDNPRRDFGDIDALADRIRATGGQPVNPIVVVRDGDHYTIVDGERRYRALIAIHGKQGMADALVFEDYSEAHAAVAMLATDDKRQLTEEERALGFQTMFRLNVDDETMAKSLGVEASGIRRARRVAPIAPEQATLDQMMAAAEFDDEEDQRAVLTAGNWSREAEEIRSRHQREEGLRPLREEVEALGISIVEDRPDGYSSEFCNTVADIDEFYGKHEGEDLYAIESGWSVAYLLMYPTPNAYAETEEERKERELRERKNAAVKGLRRALVRFVAERWQGPPEHLAAACGKLRPKISPYACEQIAHMLDRNDIEKDVSKAIAASTMSTYELIDAIDDNYGIKWQTLATDVLEAAIDDGFAENAEDTWLWGMAMRERNKADNKAGDE